MLTPTDRYRRRLITRGMREVFDAFQMTKKVEDEEVREALLELYGRVKSAALDETPMPNLNIIGNLFETGRLLYILLSCMTPLPRRYTAEDLIQALMGKDQSAKQNIIADWLVIIDLRDAHPNRMLTEAASRFVRDRYNRDLPTWFVRPDLFGEQAPDWSLTLRDVFRLGQFEDWDLRDAIPIREGVHFEEWGR